LLLVAAPDVHRPQPRAGITARIAPEHDNAAVRAEGRSLGMEAVDQDAFARPVRLHRPDLEVAVGLPRIGDEVTLGRPDRRRVDALAVGNALRSAAARIHHIELRLPATVRLEHDSGAVRRIRWRRVDLRAAGELHRLAAVEADRIDVGHAAIADR